MVRRIISMLLSFGLLFQQTGFAQVAMHELNLSGHLARIGGGFAQDKFRPLHLRYFSYDNSNNNFRLFLDKGDDKSIQGQQLAESTRELLNFFLIGVTLPNDAFWVNLRPDSQEQIIDGYLEKTDVGKIMLEADLQLKKDTAAFTSPETVEGKAYWQKLYEKAGELFGSESITIPTITRPWIVPGEIIIREGGNNAYVYKATLKVLLEQDHLQNSTVYNFKDERLKVLNEYSSRLIRELIIPKLTREINIARRYAPLRQVYYSLILARWFKGKFYGKGGLYASLIDKSDLSNLTSKEGWSRADYFKAYKKSFEGGEYNINEPVYTPFGQSVRRYFSGGMDFGAIDGVRLPAGMGILPGTKPEVLRGLVKNARLIGYRGEAGEVGNPAQSDLQSILPAREIDVAPESAGSPIFEWADVLPGYSLDLPARRFPGWVDFKVITEGAVTHNCRAPVSEVTKLINELKSLYELFKKGADREMAAGALKNKFLEITAKWGMKPAQQVEFFDDSLASSSSITKMNLASLPKDSYAGKTVFVRVDFNVPMKDGVIQNDSRIQAVLPTVRYLIAQGAKVVLAAHLGRPQKKIKEIRAQLLKEGMIPAEDTNRVAIIAAQEQLTLAPAASRLQELVAADNAKVYFNDIFFTALDAQSFIREQMHNGDVLLLENVRLNPGEEALVDAAKALKKAKGIDEEAKALAAYDKALSQHSDFAARLYYGVDVFVLEGFGVAHRGHVSVVGAPKEIPRVQGYLMEKEAKSLIEFKTAVMGGSKVSDKIKVIEALLQKVNHLLIGGAMANAFFKAQGMAVGDSIGIDDADVAVARNLLNNPKIVLPIDAVIADAFSEDAQWKVVPAGKFVPINQEVPAGWMIVDIGPQTLKMYEKYLQDEEDSIFWNGPMGAFDKLKFAEDGSRDIARAIAKARAKTVVGGGESVQAAEKYLSQEEIEAIDHVSTGGGAYLELLEKGTLPGIEALSETVSSAVKDSAYHIAFGLQMEIDNILRTVLSSHLPQEDALVTMSGRLQGINDSLGQMLNSGLAFETLKTAMGQALAQINEVPEGKDQAVRNAISLAKTSFRNLNNRLLSAKELKAVSSSLRSEDFVEGREFSWGSGRESDPLNGYMIKIFKVYKKGDVKVLYEVAMSAFDNKYHTKFDVDCALTGNALTGVLEALDDGANRAYDNPDFGTQIFVQNFLSAARKHSKAPVRWDAIEKIETSSASPIKVGNEFSWTDVTELSGYYIKVTGKESANIVTIEAMAPTGTVATVTLPSHIFSANVANLNLIKARLRDSQTTKPQRVSLFDDFKNEFEKFTTASYLKRVSDPGEVFTWTDVPELRGYSIKVLGLASGNRLLTIETILPPGIKEKIDLPEHIVASKVGTLNLIDARLRDSSLKAEQRLKLLDEFKTEFQRDTTTSYLKGVAGSPVRAVSQDEISANFDTLLRERTEARMNALFGLSKEEAIALDPQWAKIGFDGKANRLGWSRIHLEWLFQNPDTVQAVLTDAAVIRNNYKYVIFCGMGGSGLSVQTVKTTFGEKEVKIYSLRTTDPAVISDILDDIANEIIQRLEKQGERIGKADALKSALMQTLIIPISKSGTTEETVSHKKYFEDIFARNSIDAIKHLWVVTDKGSPFDTGEYPQREIQLNGQGDIGGRFTAPDTNIFLLPLALVAPEKVWDVLRIAREMNSGTAGDIFMQLAAFLYTYAKEGRKDKVTLLLPEELKDFSIWAEQLIEESLGKDGKGITLFYGENLTPESVRTADTNDRVFVQIKLKGQNVESILPAYLKNNNYPFFEIEVENIDAIGGLMLGFQRTVAAIAYLWDICFVDQPAVEGYKKGTREVMAGLQPGEKVTVPGDWKYSSFNSLKLYFGPLLEGGAISEKELAAELTRLDTDSNNAPAVYAAILNLLKGKPRFEAAELMSYGRMTPGLRNAMEDARHDIYTSGLKMPAKLGEGPDKNHSFHQNIEGGKDMWLSTYFSALDITQPSDRYSNAPAYSENLIKAQTIGTVKSLMNAKRKVLLITSDTTTENAEGDVAAFFKQVMKFLDTSASSPLQMTASDNKVYEISDEFEGVVFGTSGHRGQRDVQLSAGVAAAIAQGISEFINDEAQFQGRNKFLVIGGDTRPNNKAYQEEQSRIALANGLKVLSFEEVMPTPMCAFAIRFGDRIVTLGENDVIVGGINNTPSHNKPSDDGIKFNPGGIYEGAPSHPEVNKYVVARSNDIIQQGKGIQRVADSVEYQKDANYTKVDREKVSQVYIDRMQKMIDVEKIRTAIREKGLRWVFNTEHGAGGWWARKVLESINRDFFILLDEEPLSDFGGKYPKGPNTEEWGQLKPLLDLIVEEGLPGGGATDGDADRFFFADEKGTPINFNVVLALLFDYLRNVRGIDGSFKTCVDGSGIFEKIGTVLKREPIGFKSFQDDLKDPAKKILLAGEGGSGGLTLGPALDPEGIGHILDKDGIIAQVMFLEMVADAMLKGKTVTDLINDLYQKYGYYAIAKTASIKIPAEGKKGLEIGNKVVAKISIKCQVEGMLLGYKIKDIDTTDGLKIFLEDQTTKEIYWVLIRLSGTGGGVRAYAEAVSKESMGKATELVNSIVEQRDALIKQLIAETAQEMEASSAVASQSPENKNELITISLLQKIHSIAFEWFNKVNGAHDQHYLARSLAVHFSYLAFRNDTLGVRESGSVREVAEIKTSLEKRQGDFSEQDVEAIRGWLVKETERIDALRARDRGSMREPTAKAFQDASAKFSGLLQDEAFQDAVTADDLTAAGPKGAAGSAITTVEGALNAIRAEAYRWDLEVISGKYRNYPLQHSTYGYQGKKYDGFYNAVNRLSAELSKAGDTQEKTRILNKWLHDQKLALSEIKEEEKAIKSLTFTFDMEMAFDSAIAKCSELLGQLKDITEASQGQAQSAPQELKEGDEVAVMIKAGSAKDASSPSMVPDAPGGIDFRAMDIITEPMGSFSGLNFNLPTLSSAELKSVDLNEEMQELKHMVESGIVPSGQRIKDFVAACSQKGLLQPLMDDLIVCLTDICRLEEENVSESSAELKETLVILDSDTIRLAKL